MSVTIHTGDALAVLRTLPSESVQVCVTSPPYFNLRRYLDPSDPNSALEMGSEATPSEFIAALVAVFDEVKRVLRPDGLCFVNIGDSMSGSGRGPTGENGLGDQGKRQGFVSASSKLGNGPGTTGKARLTPRGSAGATEGIPAKNLLLIPYRFAIAMQDAGWIVRSQIVWAKTSAMPESVRDRPTSAWEPIWMFAKSRNYFFDQEAVRTAHSREWIGQASESVRWNADRIDGDKRPTDGNPAGANLRNVWTLGPEPLRDAHYAAFVSEIPRRCIKAGTSERGACPTCGVPWVRMTTTDGYTDHGGRRKRADAPGAVLSPSSAFRTGRIASRATLGWQPSCACPPAEPRPCVVLDPFGGSGTTGLVADQLGRDAVLIELNPTYAEMARARIERSAPLLTTGAVTVQAAQPSLFGEEAG